MIRGYFAILLVLVIAACAPVQSSAEFESDVARGLRIYGVVSELRASKINDYPKYWEWTAAGSGFNEWKAEFVKKYGKRKWPVFVEQAKAKYGTPIIGVQQLLEPPP